jgi:hypothetical protein
LRRRRAAVVLGAMTVLAITSTQTVHAVPTPVASDPIRQPHDFKHDVVIGKPMRKTVPLRTRSFAASAPSVTVDVLDRHGAPPATDDDQSVSFIPLDGGDWLSADLTDGHTQGRLPAGDYAVSTYVKTTEQDSGTSTTLVYLSKVTVTGDTSLILDARKGRPVAAAVDRADARTVALDVLITQKLGSRVETVGLPDTTNLYVTPTGSDSDLAFRIQARLTRNGAVMGSPYTYNVATAFAGIPADPTLRARTENLAAVRTGYAGEGAPACVGSHAGVDWGTGISISSFAELGPAPVTSTEYFTPKLDWLVDEDLSADCRFGFDDTDERSRTETFPSPESYTRDWSAAPLGPSAGIINWSTADEPALALRMLSSADAQSGTAPFAHTTGTSTLRDSDGKIVATSDEPGEAHDWPTPKPGKYTLTVDADRAAPWSDLATKQHDVWNLTVNNAGELTLPVLRYRTTLDANSRATAGTGQTITVVPDGTHGTPTLRASYDDGGTWIKVALRNDGTAWTGTVRNPASGYVSLRTTLAGVVDQTLIHAYGVH